MDNAMRKAKESGEKKLQAKDIRKVTMVSRLERMRSGGSGADGMVQTTLRQFKG